MIDSDTATATPGIRNAHDETALRATWPLVSQLRPEFDEDRFVAQMLRQIDDGCRATVLYDENGEPRAFACWRVLEMLAVGRHVYVDDLVTDAAARSRGHGKAMLDWLKDEARRLGCTRLQLDSGTQRQHAHAFYLREGLRIEAFHFGIALG
ncbi:GNAT family N-acetyltransferase [Montanilutibacter psychrotolerans]|uniref:GNAT family N-acetyltransferase n=1 Tax=Montanilutibacter psychrotolerans TaxID=1327343 RepID=A0A3M8SM29_9GAMM|nr:GNAT family N-acetyltransferase [Lysobacter psychrotolerans]RNF82407.1 GNAT family N-acetyltransferase [Lysobacter psychrotolerans]